MKICVRVLFPAQTIVIIFTNTHQSESAVLRKTVDTEGWYIKTNPTIGLELRNDVYQIAVLNLGDSGIFQLSGCIFCVQPKPLCWSSPSSVVEPELSILARPPLAPPQLVSCTLLPSPGRGLSCTCWVEL